MTPAESLARAKDVIRRVVGEHHDRPSLVIDIAVTLGAEIIEGRLPPGSYLKSVDLARRFDTSRTPVREALWLLEKQGLITIPPRRRPAVFTFEIEQIREVYQLRGQLLEMVASHVAEHAGPADIAGFKEQLAQMAEAQQDVRAYVWQNVAFHDRMTAIGGNRLAKGIIDSLLLRTLPLRRIALSQPGRIAKSLDDHQRLTRAFEEKDTALAAALVRSNHSSALATVQDAISRLA